MPPVPNPLDTNASPDNSNLNFSLTSSLTGTFYFAYGSNLSAHQMSLRLRNSLSSSVPVAVGCLRGYRWVICERGYANVVKSGNPRRVTGEVFPELRTSSGVSGADDIGRADGRESNGVDLGKEAEYEAGNDSEDVVWGIIYNMSSADEAQLDLYEGHDDYRNPEPEMNPDVAERTWKPFLQGGWDYNKHYLPVRVTKWLRERGKYGLNDLRLETIVTDGPLDELDAGDASPAQSGNVDVITSLVYVDEHRTAPGVINAEYIGRMNRGIKESVALGLSEEWVEGVMRRWVVRDVEVDDEGYVGTDRGYVAAEATETLEDVRERVLRNGGWSEVEVEGEMGGTGVRE